MFPIGDPILVFTILILVMLTGPLLADRLRIPDLVLLLAAGVLLGPNGLGVLERDSAVTLFGSVGLLYIMFLAGLEIDLHGFIKTGQRSAIFGGLTFIIPQSLGALAGKYLLGFNWPAAILLGSMFASHTLLPYPIASRLGISRTEPVTVTVGATVITDTLALLVLAVIADMARGISLGIGFWAGIATGMTVLILLIWYGIPRLTRWFFGNVTEAGGSQFLFVLVTLSACAYLSHFAKMEPIIGAFLAGAAFNRLIPEHSVLMNRVVFVGNTLFIPFFLISVGMLVDPHALISSPRSWIVSGMMVVLVIIAKYLASWIGGSLFGYASEARRVMFGLSVVQAAATLAAVLVGYDLGIFDETVLNGAIVMIAVTCPLGAWVVDRNGRSMSMHTAPPIITPASEQRIMVPVANPAFATQMLDLAFLLRDTAKPGSIHPVNIVRDDNNTEQAIARSELLLAHCMAHANAADMPVTPSVRIDVNMSDGIIRAAKELNANLILAGWGGEQSARTIVFGTVMGKLVDACPQRIFFCRLVSPLIPTRRLLVLLPPLSERRSDLIQLFGNVKFLSKQVGAELRVYTAEKESGKLRDKIISIRPSRQHTFIISDSLVEARAKLLSDIDSGDMVLLPGERRSSALWLPTLDKLSEIVATRFPGNNLLLAYPSLNPHADQMHLESTDAQAAPLTLYSCDLNADDDLVTALQRMTITAFPDNPESAVEAGRQLLTAAQSYPVQLSKEALLLHAHWEGISHPVLIAGLGAGGWELPGIEPATRIILVLLSPKTISPEQHLKILARLGRLFHDAMIVERMHNADSAQEVSAILEEKQG